MLQIKSNMYRKIKISPKMLRFKKSTFPSLTQARMNEGKIVNSCGVTLLRLTTACIDLESSFFLSVLMCFIGQVMYVAFFRR